MNNKVVIIPAKAEILRCEQSVNDIVNKVSSNIPHKLSDISTVQAEAMKIAQTLPNLEFMLSPVLMFPLKEDYSNNVNHNNNINENGAVKNNLEEKLEKF